MNRAIVHVSIVVKDYDEAIDFYTETLGFELIEDTPVPEQNKRWVIVGPSSGGSALLLAKASNENEKRFVGNQCGGRVFLFLSSDNFRRDYDQLVEKGVRIVREPEEHSYGTVAVFEDLYGNLWDLIEHKEGHPLAQHE